MAVNLRSDYAPVVLRSNDNLYMIKIYLTINKSIDSCLWDVEVYQQLRGSYQRLQVVMRVFDFEDWLIDKDTSEAVSKKAHKLLVEAALSGKYQCLLEVSDDVIGTTLKIKSLFKNHE